MRLHLSQYVAVGFAHADDEMGAEMLGPEDVGGRLEDFPVFVPAVRRLHPRAAGAVEYVRVAGVEGHRENVGAEVFQLLHVAAASSSSDSTGSIPARA